MGDAAYPQEMDWHQPVLEVGDALCASSTPIPGPKYAGLAVMSARRDARVTLAVLPNEVLLHVLGFLDVSDLLATSRVSKILFPSRTRRGLLFLGGASAPPTDVLVMCLVDHHRFAFVCLFQGRTHVGTALPSYPDDRLPSTSRHLVLNVPLTIISAPRHLTSSALWPSPRSSTASASATRATSSRRC